MQNYTLGNIVLLYGNTVRDENKNIITHSLNKCLLSTCCVPGEQSRTSSYPEGAHSGLKSLGHLFSAYTHTPDFFSSPAFLWAFPLLSTELGIEKAPAVLALFPLISLPFLERSETCGSGQYLCFSSPSILAWWCYQALELLLGGLPLLKGTTTGCFVETWQDFLLFRLLSIIHINEGGTEGQLLK